VHITLFRHDGGWMATWKRVLMWLEKRKWLSVLMLIVFMAYPSLIKTGFSMHDCQAQAIGGIHYLDTDLSVSCDSPEHAFGTTFAWAIIFLCCLGLPLLFTWWLRRHEGQIRLTGGVSRFYGSFGFLYQGYRTDHWTFYCWEALTMIRKAAIVLIAAVTKDSYYQVQSATIILALFLGMQLHFSPYVRPLFNRLEAWTLFALVLTQTISLIHFRYNALQDAAVIAAAAGVKVAQNQGGSDTTAVFRALMNEDTITALLLIINVGTMAALLATYVVLREADRQLKRGRMGPVDRAFYVLCCWWARDKYRARQEAAATAGQPRGYAAWWGTGNEGGGGGGVLALHGVGRRKGWGAVKGRATDAAAIRRSDSAPPKSL
jgi:hypothetical protein